MSIDPAPAAERQVARVLTTQNTAPLVYALVAGLVYGLIGAVEGALGALATIAAAHGQVSAEPLLIGAALVGGGAFVKRALEGLRDTTRAQAVEPGQVVTVRSPATPLAPIGPHE